MAEIETSKLPENVQPFTAETEGEDTELFDAPPAQSTTTQAFYNEHAFDRAQGAPDDIGLKEGFTVSPEPPQYEYKGLWETAKAAFRRDNDATSVVVDETKGAFEVDPDFNLTNELIGTEYEDRLDLFLDVHSRAELHAHMAHIKRLEEDRRTVEAGGWYGTGFTFLAALLSPTILIPGTFAARGAKLGYSASRSALNVGASAAAGAAIDEAILHSSQKTRTGTESLFAISGAVILGGALGGFGAKIVNARLRNKLAKNIDDDLARIDDGVDPAETMLKDAEDLVSAARTRHAGGEAASLSAATARPTLDELTTYGRAAQGVHKATAWANPILRLLNSPSPVARDLATQLFENPIYMKANAEGKASPAAIESLVKRYTDGIVPDLLERAGTVNRIRSAVLGARAEKSIYADMRKAGINMSRREYRERIGLAMRRGDEDPDNEFVTKAAQMFRKDLFEPMRKELNEVGFDLPDSGSRTAESYLHRLWNVKKLISGEREFKDIMRNYIRGAVAEQLEKDAAETSRKIARLEREIEGIKARAEADSPGNIDELASLNKEIAGLREAVEEAERSFDDAARFDEAEGQLQDIGVDPHADVKQALTERAKRILPDNVAVRIYDEIDPDLVTPAALLEKKLPAKQQSEDLMQPSPAGRAFEKNADGKYDAAAWEGKYDLESKAGIKHAIEDISGAIKQEFGIEHIKVADNVNAVRNAHAALTSMRLMSEVLALPRWVIGGNGRLALKFGTGPIYAISTRLGRLRSMTVDKAIDKVFGFKEGDKTEPSILGGAHRGATSILPKNTRLGRANITLIDQNVSTFAHEWFHFLDQQSAHKFPLWRFGNFMGSKARNLLMWIPHYAYAARFTPLTLLLPKTRFTRFFLWMDKDSRAAWAQLSKALRRKATRAEKKEAKAIAAENIEKGVHYFNIVDHSRAKQPTVIQRSTGIIIPNRYEGKPQEVFARSFETFFDDITQGLYDDAFAPYRREFGLNLYHPDRLDPNYDEIIEGFEAVFDALRKNATERGALAKRGGLSHLFALKQGEDGIRTEGLFDPDEMSISISAAALDPKKTLSHEAVHALKAMKLFSDSEWKTLSKAAFEEGWLSKELREVYEDFYDGRPPAQIKEQLIEEAIAVKYAEWDAGKARVSAQVQTLFQRLKEFFARIAGALKESGIASVDDIFARIESGEIARRGGKKSTGDIEDKTVYGEVLNAARGALADSAHPQQALETITHALTRMQGGNVSALVDALPDYLKAQIEPLISGAEKLDVGQIKQVEDLLEGELARLRETLDGATGKQEDVVSPLEARLKTLMARRDEIAATPGTKRFAEMQGKLEDLEAELSSSTRSPLREGGDAFDQAEFDTYLNEIVNGLFDKLTRRVVDDVPDFIFPGEKGPLKGRTNLVPDEMVEQFLDSDIELVARRYARSASAQVELRRKFGEVGLKDQFVFLKESHDAIKDRINANTDLSQAGRAAAIERAEKDYAADVRDLEFARDKLLGNYKHDVETTNWHRATDVALSFSYMMALGGVLIASATDPFRLLMTQGMRRTFGTGLPSLLASMKGGKGFGLSAEAAKKYAGIAEIMNNNRLASQADLMDPHAAGTPFERFVDNMTTGFSKATGLPYWNQFLKEFTSVIVQDRILENAIKGLDNLSASEARYMNYLGFDDGAVRQLADLHKAGIVEKIDGVYTVKPEAMPDALRRQFFAGVIKDVDTTIVTRGIGDIPVFGNTPAGKLILQFKSFGLATNQRVLMRGLQEEPHRFLEGLVSMMMIGMLISALKNIESGREMSDNPGTWLAEGLDRSGILSLAFEMNNILEKHGVPGIFKMAAATFPDKKQKATASRFATRNNFASLFGPAFGMGADISQLISSVNSGDLTPADIKRIRRLTPYASLPYWRWFLDQHVVPHFQDEVR